MDEFFFFSFFFPPFRRHHHFARAFSFSLFSSSPFSLWQNNKTIKITKNQIKGEREKDQPVYIELQVF